MVCSLCKKKLSARDEIVTDRARYHKLCFKCAHCNCNLRFVFTSVLTSAPNTVAMFVYIMTSSFLVYFLRSLNKRALLIVQWTNWLLIGWPLPVRLLSQLTWWPINWPNYWPIFWPTSVRLVLWYRRENCFAGSIDTPSTHKQVSTYLSCDLHVMAVLV